MKPKVLLIEDEKDLIDVIGLELSHAKVELDLTVAEDVSQAANLLSTSHFDLIISDISLPGSQKQPILNVLHDYAHDTPIMIFSGNASSTLISQDHQNVIEKIDKLHCDRLIEKIENFVTISQSNR